MSPRSSNFGNLALDEESGGAGSAAAPKLPRPNGPQQGSYPAPPGTGIFSPLPGVKKKASGAEGGKELHMFVWSSSASPVSEGGIHVFRGAEFGNDHAGLPHPAENLPKGTQETCLHFSCCHHGAKPYLVLVACSVLPIPSLLCFITNWSPLPSFC